jgi:hypothetical protein
MTALRLDGTRQGAKVPANASATPGKVYDCGLAMKYGHTINSNRNVILKTSILE